MTSSTETGQLENASSFPKLHKFEMLEHSTY